ncbi:hypothetical protein E2C01_082947 [Portunus trituberculatus]|uniref:Uncharacterized protein n=1 Tax=Portunus trituberculatus TaxID=210409 RepID=A0A5B7J378_PORTR|nr:hypothetical protein [Portunus trituberculatus]
MISTLYIAKKLIRTKFLISLKFIDCGKITYIFKRLLFQSHGFLRVVS